MWIQSMSEELEKTLQELKQSADEKEALLEVIVGSTRNQLMAEIVLLRKSHRLLRRFNIMREAYEELIEIKWNYDKSSTLQILTGENNG